jgi:hypothetical protein
LGMMKLFVQEAGVKTSNNLNMCGPRARSPYNFYP